MATEVIKPWTLINEAYFKQYSPIPDNFNIKDIDTISHFIENINQNDKTIKELKQIKNDRYNKLNKMINFSLSKKCLHQQISEYFGIPHKGKCMMCSNCIKKK